MPTIPISGEPLWGDTAFVDPGASSVGGGTGGGTGAGGGGTGGPLPAGFQFQRAITIDHTKIGSDLTNYPLGFIGLSSWLATVAHGGNVQNSNGYDIAFAADSAGTQSLAFERVRWNPTSGDVEFYVNVPTVSSSVDTVIYIFYDNASVTTDLQSAGTTWDSNYLAVYHFGDGTTLSLSDSTNNGHTATNHGTTAVGADFGGGASFHGHGDHGDAGGSDYIDLGDPFNTVPITLEVFGSIGNLSSGNTIASNADVSGHGYQIHQAAASPLAVKLNGTDFNFVVTGGGYNPHYYAFSYDGTTLVTFDADAQAGQFQGSNSASSALTASTTNLLLGKEPTNGTNLFFGGTIEEVRISKVARSLDYFKAATANVFHPSTSSFGVTPFYAIGSAAAPTSSGGGGGGGGSASIVLNPDQGFAGSNYNVAVTGTGTHFATGVTAVTMSGDGVTITNVVVTDATALLFNVAIAPGASLGARTVTTQSGTEAPTASFTILPAVAPPPSTQPGFVRGDLGWSQLRLGRDGRWGLGLFGCSTDGSFLPGNIPTVNQDGTLIGTGQSITSILQTALGNTTGTGVNGVPAGSGGITGVNGGTGGTGVNTPPSANGLPAIAGSVTPPPTGVRITVTAAGISAATITDIQGNFQINIPGIGTYTITPSLAGFAFSPISQSVDVSQTATPTLTTPFTATAIAPTSPGNTTVANQIFADMAGGNESTLHGLPASFGMAHGPTIGISRNVGSQHALVWWLDAYQDAAIASTAVSTQIEIKSAQLWWLRASTGQWVKGLDPATSAAAVTGGYYAENLTGSQLSSITFTTQGDGGISFAMLSPDAGRAFAPSPRVAISPSDFGGIAVTVFARLIGSDTANAHYLLGVGADAYASTTGPGDKQTLGTGKFKKLTTTYRSFSMTTLTAQQILDNPPPISFTGVSV